MATRRAYSDLDLRGLRILNVGTPDQPGAAANKVYVDDQLRDAVDAATASLTAAFEAADVAARTAEDTNNQAIRDAFTAADTSIRTDFAAADAALRADLEGGLQDATSTLRGEFQAADTSIRNDFAAADASLDTTLRASFGAADAAIRTEFAAADDVVRAEFAAADAQVRTDLTTAIGTETTRATTAEQQITDRIQQLDADSTADVNAVRADLASEVAARTDGDTTLRGEFQAADAAIRTDFAAADSGLSNRIDSLESATTASTDTIRAEFAAADAANLSTVRGELAATDANLRAYTESTIQSLTSGQVLKGAVRVAVDEDIDPANPPAVIQGETLADSDTVLLTGQVPMTENGPYTFAGGALVRATNWNTDAEAVVGSYWVVRAGVHADQFALLTNDAFTLDTDGAEFLFIEAIPDAVPALVELVPATAAGAEATVPHNFGTLDTVVVVTETASGQDVTSFIAFRKTAAAVILQPDIALDADELTVRVGRLRG